MGQHATPVVVSKQPGQLEHHQVLAGGELDVLQKRFAGPTALPRRNQRLSQQHDGFGPPVPTVLGAKQLDRFVVPAIGTG